jgi:hypothetical protein
LAEAQQPHACSEACGCKSQPHTLSVRTVPERTTVCLSVCTSDRVTTCLERHGDGVADGGLCCSTTTTLHSKGNCIAAYKVPQPHPAEDVRQRGNAQLTAVEYGTSMRYCSKIFSRMISATKYRSVCSVTCSCSQRRLARITASMSSQRRLARITASMSSQAGRPAPHK